MKETTIDSKRIARWVNERGLQDIAAFLVDAVRPFGLLAAQTVYFFEPLVGGRNGLLHELANILSDSDQMDTLLDQMNQERKDHD
jgi:hypothetical protein